MGLAHVCVCSCCDVCSHIWERVCEREREKIEKEGVCAWWMFANVCEILSRIFWQTIFSRCTYMSILHYLFSVPILIWISVYWCVWIWGWAPCEGLVLFVLLLFSVCRSCFATWFLREIAEIGSAWDVWRQCTHESVHLHGNGLEMVWSGSAGWPREV